MDETLPPNSKHMIMGLSILKAVTEKKYRSWVDLEGSAQIKDLHLIFEHFVASHRMAMACQMVEEALLAVELFVGGVVGDLLKFGAPTESLFHILRRACYASAKAEEEEEEEEKEAEEEAWAKFYMALGLWIAGRLPEAEIEFENSLALAKTDVLKLKVSSCFGDYYRLGTGLSTLAVPYYRAELDIACRLGDDEHKIRALWSLGSTLCFTRDLEEARTIQRQVAEMGEQSGHSFYQGVATYLQGLIHFSICEQFMEAIVKFEETIMLLLPFSISDGNLDIVDRYAPYMPLPFLDRREWLGHVLQCRFWISDMCILLSWYQMGASMMNLGRNCIDFHTRVHIVGHARQAFQMQLQLARHLKFKNDGLEAMGLQGLACTDIAISNFEGAVNSAREMLKSADKSSNSMIKAIACECLAKSLLVQYDLLSNDAHRREETIQQIQDNLNMAEDICTSMNLWKTLEGVLWMKAQFLSQVCQETEEASKVLESANSIFIKFCYTSGIDSEARISTLEEREIVLNILQQNLIKSSEVEWALVWAERGRTRDMFYSMTKDFRPHDYVNNNNNQLAFDTDREVAWHEIQSIYKHADKDVVFLIYSYSQDTGILLSYLLHCESEPKAFATSLNEALQNWQESNALLNSVIQQLLKGIAENEETEVLNEQLHLFYQLLFAKWEVELEMLDPKTIMFIPSRDLFMVPFAALYDGERYLIERYAMAIIPSLRVFKYCCEDRMSPDNDLRALVVSNPAFGDPQLHLDFAKPEAEVVTQALGNRFSVHVLEEDAATKGGVLDLLPECGWVHIISHAFVGPDFPNGSLILAPSTMTASTTADATTAAPSTSIAHPPQKISKRSPLGIASCLRGPPHYETAPSPPSTLPGGASVGSIERTLWIKFAESAENHDMLTGKMIEDNKKKMKAEVVVLSACCTGLGQACTEGMLGLARSFHTAGARAVLVSLWRVEDDSTMTLMEHLYHNLLHGEDDARQLASALQHAMITLIHEEDEIGCLKYNIKQWAPFIISGCPTIKLHY